MPVTTAQIKAARTLLGWTTQDLADFSDLSVSTINNLENDRHSTHKKTMEKVMLTFEKFGVCFVESSGVLVNSSMKIYEGLSGIQKYFDYNYEVLKATSGEHRIFTIDGLVLKQKLGPMAQAHYERLSRLENVKVRMFTPSGNFLNFEKYNNFKIKQIPLYQASLAAHSYFSGNVAIFFMEKMRVIVIQDQALFDISVKNFDYIWDSFK
ncbi:hypothetical protein NF27_FX00180 [Candidatus Jidaibacter acanthamoeba]|uniref:HTH cro/C1-type domain-containing protein n=1 Tax=Candidatus Jidaibacter acanthamoebae TaxID=86105 RepID=A0A0C1MRQ4_9RICK|nr:helix-turn-helix domain-containing protein [Candidatus Jidaibacter acanthamoeba]KIE04757.1 hypothetical protein NF27_FX00180 [Candidatus Jidaibacter acanthamoeba]